MKITVTAARNIANTLMYAAAQAEAAGDTEVDLAAAIAQADH